MTLALNPSLAGFIDIHLPSKEALLEKLIAVNNSVVLKENFYPNVVDLLAEKELPVNKVVALLILARLEYVTYCEKKNHSEIASACTMDLKKYLQVLITGDIAQETAMELYRSITPLVVLSV